MKFSNVQLSSLKAGSSVISFHKKYTYFPDNTAYSRNVNFSKKNNNILMTKYDGTSQDGLSYFSMLDSTDGQAVVNYVSSEAIKVYSNVAAADNSGFYLAGNDTQDGGNFINCLISKIDNSGNEVWKKSYKASASTNSYIHSIDLDSNGNIIAGGAANGVIDNANIYPFFIKSSPSGNTLMANIVENATVGHRVVGITVDQTTDYVYFVTRGTNEVLFGCLDNAFTVVWLKKLSYTGTLTFRSLSAAGPNDSKKNMSINGSSLFVSFVTNNTGLVGGAPTKPVIIEFNKTNGNVIKSQYVNARHDLANITFENGLMKLFGTVLGVGGNWPFVSTITNWATTPSYAGYYYNMSTLFSFTVGFATGIDNSYIFGSTDYTYLIKTNGTNYDYLASTSFGNSFSNTTVSLSNESYTNSTVTSSYNTPITPTYTWDTTIMSA